MPPDASEGDLNLSPSRAKFTERAHDARTLGILRHDERVYLHQSLSTPCLNALSHAQGSRLVDVQGRSILDFHGNSVHQVGHAHPKVIAAVKRQLDELAFCPRRFTNLPAIALADRLGSLTGGALTKVLLAPGGSLAIGIALKLARLATGRHKTVSMWGSFHGAGLDAISIGGEALFRSGLEPFLPGCFHVAPCAPSTCQLGCGGNCTATCAAAVEDAIEQEGDIAAVIAEPVRCTTVDIPPREYWQRIRRACDRSGTLLIFDEIPTCLGRTGRMFSYEHFGVVPDIVVIGKGLGGGVFPQAAVMTRPELDVGRLTALGHYTHEKSPVGSAAALATLDVIESEALVARSASLGTAWRSSLGDRMMSTSRICDVRGLGLLIGIELDSAAAADGLCDRVLYRCMEAGLSFKVSDRRVLTLTPPLTVSVDDLDEAAGILHRSIIAG